MATVTVWVIKLRKLATSTRQPWGKYNYYKLNVMAVSGHTTRRNNVSRVRSASASVSRTAPGAAAGVKGYVCWASRPGPWPRPVAGRARSIGQSALWFFYTCPADCRERSIRVSETGSSDVGSPYVAVRGDSTVLGIVQLTKYLLLLHPIVYIICCITSRNKRGIIQYINSNIHIFIHSF